jgi:hypothetical protein
MLWRAEVFVEHPEVLGANESIERGHMLSNIGRAADEGFANNRPRHG